MNQTATNFGQHHAPINPEPNKTLEFRTPALANAFIRGLEYANNIHVTITGRLTRPNGTTVLQILDPRLNQRKETA